MDYAKVAEARNFFTLKVLLYLKRHMAISIVVGIAVVLGAYAVFAGDRGPEYESAVVARKTIVREVSATGKVKPAQTLTLSFETSGRVAGVSAKEGMEVTKGTVLARQDAAALFAEVDSARARVAQDEAALLELKRGLRPEERSVERQKAENSKSAYDDTLASLLVTIKSAYTTADDAFRGRADKLFENANSAAPRYRVPISDGALQGELEMLRAAFSTAMISWRKDVDSLGTPPFDALKLNALAVDSERILGEVRGFLDRMSYSLTFAMSPQAISQASVDSYRADLSTARTNVNTSLASLQSAVESARDAELDYTLAKRQLELDEAPASPEEIAQREALLSQSRAAFSAAQARAAKASIVAPISGIVTDVSVEVGEIVGANTKAVSMISTAAFEIEAFIPETDIASVRPGAAARVTLDAYGESIVWDASIVSVNPAETVLEGVSTYKTVLQFAGSDDRVKSGMTANIDIVTERKENALSLPVRFLEKRDDGTSFVLIQNADDGSVSERTATTGISGSEGEIEILSGLEEGEEAVLPV